MTIVKRVTLVRDDSTARLTIGRDHEGFYVKLTERTAEIDVFSFKANTLPLAIDAANDLFAKIVAQRKDFGWTTKKEEPWTTWLT